MEFKLQSTVTITEFVFEDNSADNPGLYKVVWESPDHHKNTKVTVWRKLVNLFELKSEWQAVDGALLTQNFVTPSTYESRRILNQYIK